MPTRPLTETFARYIKVPSRRYFWDPRLPGFGLRVSPPRRRGPPRKAWVFRYKAHGETKQREIRLGPYPALPAKMARERAQELFYAVLRGADPRREEQVQREAMRVTELCRRFEDEHCPKLAAKSQKTYRDKIKNHVLNPDYGMGELLVSEVSREHVQRLVDCISNQTNRDGLRCIGQAIKVRGLVSSIFSFAVYIGEREPNTSPTTGVRIDRRRRDWELDKVEPIGHVFEEEEAKAVWAALDSTRIPETARDCLRLIALTGVRKDEARTLKWRDVVLVGKHPHLQIRRHKTNVKQPIKEVPLVERAVGLLRRWGPNQPDAWAFRSPVDAGKPIGDLWTPWSKVRRAAGVPKARIHDLRGLAACSLVEAGWTEQQIMSFMGWTSAEMVRCYVAASRATLRRGARIIEMGVVASA